MIGLTFTDGFAVNSAAVRLQPRRAPFQCPLFVATETSLRGNLMWRRITNDFCSRQSASNNATSDSTPRTASLSVTGARQHNNASTLSGSRLPSSNPRAPNRDCTSTANKDHHASHPGRRHQRLTKSTKLRRSGTSSSEPTLARLSGCQLCAAHARCGSASSSRPYCAALRRSTTNSSAKQTVGDPRCGFLLVVSAPQGSENFGAENGTSEKVRLSSESGRAHHQKLFQTPSFSNSSEVTAGNALSRRVVVKIDH